jgi:hypothetical protein
MDNGAGGGPGLLLAWMLLLGTGLTMMASYAYSPGAMRDAGPEWPSGVALAPATDRPTLVVGLHPRCTCSAATLHELAPLLADASLPPKVDVLLYQPAGSAAPWSQRSLAAGLEASARKLPGATVRDDRDGRLAQQFGMLTSGAVALFAPSGRLLFRGGVTRARGHEGESEGARQLRLALSEGSGGSFTIPVFGCPLRSATPEG